jgi:hypothetical protein
MKDNIASHSKKDNISARKNKILLNHGGKS